MKAVATILVPLVMTAILLIFGKNFFRSLQGLDSSKKQRAQQLVTLTALTTGIALLKAISDGNINVYSWVILGLWINVGIWLLVWKRQARNK